MVAANNKHSGVTVEINKDNVKQQKFNIQESSVDSRLTEKRMHYLTDSEMEKFKTRLLAKREEILGTVLGLKNEISATATNSSGPMDIGDMAEFNQTIEDDYRLLESEKRVLDEVDGSLERIKDGTYGICQKCMRQIPKRRLQIIPWARYCVPCESEIESQKYTGNGKKSQSWAEKHAYRLHCLFEPWQRPLGIDGREYFRHTANELIDYYDDPLRRSLIESL